MNETTKNPSEIVSLWLKKKKKNDMKRAEFYEIREQEEDSKRSKQRGIRREKRRRNEKWKQKKIWICFSPKESKV